MQAEVTASVDRYAVAAKPLLLRMKAVMQVTGLGKSTIYRLIASERFPSPVRLTNNVVAWRLSDLEAWTASKPQSK
jgi:prophage regulatory protein